MRTRLLLIPVLCFAAVAIGQDKKVDPPKTDDDPIARQLLKDKEAFVSSLEKAREDMLKGFDKYYEAVKANKSLKIEAQLAQLEKIEADKKAFEEAGTIPGTPGMKVALSEYRAAQKKAELVCKAAFDKAAKAYRDKGDVKAAGATLEEAKEFLAKDPTVGGGAVGAAGVAIVARHSNKVIAPNGADDGAKLMTADFVKGDQGQLWKVVAAGEGLSYIENVKTGMVMTATGKNNGAEVFISKKITPASETQLWKLSAVPGQKDVQKVFAKPSGKLIGVDAKSKDAGARILLWADQNEAPQWFGFFVPK
ncbi:MAG: RICIN domain-containing protein [Planctomycetes bacterium]|nr:RICIN domain-containing protein [Planctomycetota bacterium]